MAETKKHTFAVVDRDRMPVPDYLEENTNTKSFVNWGRDNQFPQHVNYMVRNSPTLKSCIESITNYIVGNGVNVKDEASKWKTEVNRRHETMEDLISQIAYDLIAYGGFAINVLYSKLGTVAELYALDFTRIRSNYNNTVIYYAPKWGQWTSKYDAYPAFDREKVDPTHPSQIFYYKGNSRRVYPIPTYEGAFRDCLTEIEASKLQLTEMANGMNAKTIITLPNDTGTLTEDEKNEIEEAIRAKFTGSEATSSFFLTWKEEGLSEVKVDVIKQEDDSNKFVTIKKSARENIFISLRMNPMLAGLNVETGFSREEFAEALALFQRTVVSGYQRKIEKAIDSIIAVPGGIQLIPFTLEREDE